MSRLLLLLTGDPVPSAAALSGGFGKMIPAALDGGEDVGWDVQDLRAGSPLPLPGAYDAVVVSGSPALLEDQAPWMLSGMEYLGALFAASVPTLGICFGHQMLGVALGGKVGRNPRGREIGSVELQTTAYTPLLPQVESGHVNASHVDSILELPPGARAVATTELEPHAAVHFGRRSWGVQFHPEFDSAITGCYIRERAEVLRSEGLEPDQLLAQLHEGYHGRSALGCFVRDLTGSG